MTTKKVLLNSFDKVKTFINLVASCKGDLDLATGRYNVDAKSIMGIFSLDISAPLTLTIHDDSDVPMLEERLKDYLVD